MAGEIIVLDDEEDYAQLLMDLLESEGYRVSMSTNPETVVGMLKDRRYDLVVADYMMPEMNGAEFLVEVRKIRPGLPVIMISGLMNTPDLIKVANIGVTLVLEKPFDQSLFLEYVSRFVEPDGERGKTAESEDHGAGATADAEAPAVGRYPQPAIYLSDASPYTAAALQQVWTALANKRHIFVCMPEEREFFLLVREIGRWRGAPETGALHLRMRDLREDRSKAVFRRVAEAEYSSPLVAVNGMGSTPAEQLLAVMRFMPECENRSDLATTTFLYCFFGLDPSSELLEGEHLPEFVAGRLIYFPGLRVRPLDLATYASRILSTYGGKRLSLEASRCLVHYEWPGNYGQLETVLRDAVETSTLREISRETLLEAMRRSRPEDDISAIASGAGMREYLVARQAEFLRYHARRDDDPATLASRIGLPVEAVKDSDLWEQRELLFPELLNP